MVGKYIFNLRLNKVLRGISMPRWGNNNNQRFIWLPDTENFSSENFDKAKRTWNNPFRNKLSMLKRFQFVLSIMLDPNSDL